MLAGAWGKGTLGANSLSIFEAEQNLPHTFFKEVSV